MNTSSKPLIMIIGAGTLQVPVCKVARDMGLRVLTVDRAPDPPARSVSDVFVQCDIYDAPGALDVARRYEVDAVAAVAIDAEDTAAFVGEALGLPAPPLALARMTRNKHLLYRTLDGDVPVPRWHVAEGSRDTPPFDPPWIVRPANNSGSRGTSIVRRPDDFPSAYHTAKTACVGGSGVVVVNELLEHGPEWSTEVIRCADGWRYLNSVLRLFWPRALGNSVEIGHVSPSPDFPDLTDDVHETLRTFCVATANALGLDWGVLKIDTIWPRGSPHPYVMEATLRLSGGLDSTHTFPLAYGRSSVRAYLKLCMGQTLQPDDPDVTGEPGQWAAAVGFTLPVGTVRKAPTPRRLAELLGVEDVIYRVTEGDTIGPFEDCTSRAGFCVTTGQNWADAWMKGLEAAALVPSFFEYSTGD